MMAAMEDEEEGEEEKEMKAAYKGVIDPLLKS